MNRRKKLNGADIYIEKKGKNERKKRNNEKSSKKQKAKSFHALHIE